MQALDQFAEAWAVLTERREGAIRVMLTPSRRST